MRLLTIVILISSVLIFGCSDFKNDKQTNHSEVEKINSTPSFEDFKKNAKVSKQSFKINPKRDTLLRCRKGTQLYFPANSFDKEFENITIEIQEFYTLKDFISQNLTTLSDGRLIESGGMISVNAFANNQQIELAEGKDITISFPKTDNSNNMSLFFGQKDSIDNINWTINDTTTQLTKTSQLPLDTIYNCYFTSWGYNYGDPGIYIMWDTLNRIYELHEYFDKFYSSKIPLQEKDCNDSEFSVNLFFSLNASNKIDSIEFEPSNSTSAYDAVLRDYLKSLPPINPVDTTSMYRNNKEEFRKHKKLDRRKYKLMLRGEKRISIKNFRKKMSSSEKKLVKIDELNNYIFQSSKLGWINCDRFLQIAESSKMDFHIKMNSNENSRIYILFKDFNSLLEIKGTDNSFIFKDAPRNTDIEILAIKTENNKTQYSHKEISTNVGSIVINEFSDFELNTIDEILD